MSEINTAIGTRIVDAIEQFERELSKTGLQHKSADAFADVVRDYAAALIDQHMRNERGVSVEVFDRLMRKWLGS